MRMELTKRADYAVRAMLALSRARDGRLLSVRRIADEMDIPVRFLPQVMGDLTAAGLVRAIIEHRDADAATRAIGEINSTSSLTLSPGMHISASPSNLALPVTSVVRK